MNSVFKFAVAAAIVGPALIASSAFAASISDARFSNNQTSIDGAGGSTVSGTFTLTVGPNEVVEWFRTMPAGNPFTEASVGGTLGYQEGVYTNVQFTAKLPPNTGTYNVDVQGAGIFGGIRAINGGDNVVVGPTSVGTVRVIANGSTGGSNDGAPNGIPQSVWDKFMAWMMNAGSTPAPAPAPVTPAACTSLANHSMGAMYGVTNSQNGILQGFLIGEGYSIPLLQSNQASYGFWGNQTQAAVSAFKSGHNCN